MKILKSLTTYKRNFAFYNNVSYNYKISIINFRNFYYYLTIRHILLDYKAIMYSLRVENFVHFHLEDFLKIFQMHNSIKKLPLTELHYVKLKYNFDFIVKFLHNMFFKSCIVFLFNHSNYFNTFDFYMEFLFIRYSTNVFLKIFLNKFSDDSMEIQLKKNILFRFFKRCKYFGYRIFFSKVDLLKLVNFLTYEFSLLFWHFFNFNKDFSKFFPLIFFIVMDKYEVQSYVNACRTLFFFKVLNFLYLNKYYYDNFLLVKDFFFNTVKFSFYFKLFFLFYIIDNKFIYFYLNALDKSTFNKTCYIVNVKFIEHVHARYEYLIFSGEG